MKNTHDRGPTNTAEKILSAIDTAALTIDALLQTSYHSNDVQGMSLSSQALSGLSTSRFAIASALPSSPKVAIVNAMSITKRRPGRPRKLTMITDTNDVSTTSVVVKRKPGRPRKNSVSSSRVLSPQERERRKAIHTATSAGELTGSKTYRPYLLQALHEVDNGQGADFSTIQGRMRGMMDNIIKPADDVNVPGTQRPRWMYQTSALRSHLLSQGVIVQVGSSAAGEPVYSITASGISELNPKMSTNGKPKRGSSKSKAIALVS